MTKFSFALSCGRGQGFRGLSPPGPQVPGGEARLACRSNPVAITLMQYVLPANRSQGQRFFLPSQILCVSLHMKGGDGEMMERFQIHLREDQLEALRVVRDDTGVAVSESIRRAVDQYLRIDRKWSKRRLRYEEDDD